jgi:hypothetical protein
VATLSFNGTTAQVIFNPISSALSNMPNAQATIAAIARFGATGNNICELREPSGGGANWYHGMGFEAGADIIDDDGTSFVTYNTNIATPASGAGNYRIFSVDWATSAGTSTGNSHYSSLFSAAESWTHTTSTGTVAANRAGPGTTGRFFIGSEGGGRWFTGEIALIGVWAGVRFTNTQAEELWINLRTSDWYNHSAGQPTMLVELTSTTPVDIGANPSTLNVVTAATATGADPTGWTFDGQGTPSAPVPRSSVRSFEPSRFGPF